MGRHREPEPPGPRASDRRERWVALALVALAIAACGAVGIAALDEIGFDPSSDEGVYRSYTRRLHEGGWGAYPALFREFNADPARWMWPPPHRLVHSALCALAARLTGPTLATLSYVSLASQLALVALNFALARRRVGDLRAALISMGLACSPLLVRLGVQPLSDATGLLFATASFWTFLALLDDPSRRRAPAFAAAFALAIAAKELNGLLAPPFLAIAVLERRGAPRRMRWSDLAALLLLPAVVVAGAWMLAAWSWTAPFQALRNVLASSRHNPYMLEHNVGPWYRYGVDLLALSPVATLLALSCAVAALARRPISRPARAALVLAAVLVLEASFFAKNIRYFPVLDLSVRVAAVEFAFAFAGPRRAWLRWIAIAALVAISALDLWDAATTFEWLYDPVTSEILRLRGIGAGT
jgi:4-amino-4-deoxy-L-arabinose transferase-like glycosyltransferase